MEHAGRWQLAQDLCARMVAKYPGDVIVGGVYGSTARGTDTPWSDLELFFVYYQGLIDTFSFQALPEGYGELVPALWSARDPDVIVSLAQALVDNFWRLLAEQGVRRLTYHSLNDVP